MRRFKNSKYARLYSNSTLGVPTMTFVWEKRFFRTNVEHGRAKRFVFPAPKIKSPVNTVHILNSWGINTPASLFREAGYFINLFFY
jgi:hypothetical protein